MTVARLVPLSDLNLRAQIDTDNKIVGFVNEHGVEVILSVAAGAQLEYANDVYELQGDDAPVDAAAASVALASAGADNNLTATAVTKGTAGNAMRAIIVQGAGVSVPLSVVVTGTVALGTWLATVTLPTDGSSVAAASTAAEVKTAWDASAAVDAATIAYEGDGSGTVAVHAVASFTGGVAGTGYGVAGPGSRFTDYTNANLYINTGTKIAPAWTVIT